MADELGAVRRTARPTGDRQTPETGPQESAGTTNTASPVSGDQPAVSSRVSSQDDPAFQAATLAVLEALNPVGPDDLQPNWSTEFARYVAEQVETVLFPGPECDMEAYAALPPCTACEGGGQDTHGTVFEAPYAVHFAGPPVKAEGRRRQLCMWCGHVISDIPSRKGEDAPHWPQGVLVRVEDGVATEQPYDGGELPPGCCALPDDEQPTPGPGCYPPADGWDGVSIAVDPNDGYPVDLCGKHTGTCSNRCLLPARHDGECDDDPRPDEAQETRAAADWPAEPVDAVEAARRQGVDLYEETAGYHPNTGEPHDPVVRGG